jgi:proton-translocating NADH-quinone oxidoreductase chain M
MNMFLQILLLTAFIGAFLTYLLGKISSKVRDIFAVFISLAILGLTAFLYGNFSTRTFYLGFFNIPLILRVDMLSWLFAITIATIGTLSIIFSLSYIRGKERTDFYYLMMLLVNAGMLGIVLSGDLISFYIFWEIMSWSAFLLISYKRGPALSAGMKYIVMSIIGSVAMLIGIISIYTSYGTLAISEIAPLITSASTGYILFVSILFFIAFGIKNAVLPFHTWLPPAHSEAPSPFSAVLSGVLIKMGVYGFILIMYVLIGLNKFLTLGEGLLSFHYILSILGAITIIVPTFIAMIQDDAKRLLAWSTISQAGYIFLGIAFGTSLSITSGIFHFLNHAIFKALLFMVVGAVEYRTNGNRDLNSLGGLIKKMPITFIGALVGVCGLIGVPLTNGFVSKWLIYKTLILEEAPFLAFIALIGTWGTILYSYKLIHNMFLGQLPEKYKDIKKAPFNMQLPILVLSFAVLLFGILPGIPLKIINAIGTSFGMEALDVNIWGITSETGALNTVIISSAVLVASIIVWMLLRLGKRSIPVSQEDSYAAGGYIPKEKYHYTVKFYDPFHRMVKTYFRDFVDMFYSMIVRIGRKFSGRVRKIYSGDLGYYVIYILLFLVILIIIKMGLALW